MMKQQSEIEIIRQKSEIQERQSQIRNLLSRDIVDIYELHAEKYIGNVITT